MADSPRHIVVVSDTHAGSQLSLCPPGGVRLDGGGVYKPSRLQLKLWAMWEEFCGEWVSRVTRGESFVLVHNGDALEGVHHRATDMISSNLGDQAQIAFDTLKPLVERASAYYHIRGTEAHVGPSAVEEERLAMRLGAKADHDGNFARWELYYNLRGFLCQFTHHISVSGSSMYQWTAPGKEMVENRVEAGRWGWKPAQILVRAHRHLFTETRDYGSNGLNISTTTPSWQLKTGFVFKTQGRLSTPQIGGIVITAGDEEVYTRAKVWGIERPATEGDA